MTPDSLSSLLALNNETFRKKRTHHPEADAVLKVTHEAVEELIRHRCDPEYVGATRLLLIDGVPASGVDLSEEDAKKPAA